MSRWQQFKLSTWSVLLCIIIIETIIGFILADAQKRRIEGLLEGNNYDQLTEIQEKLEEIEDITTELQKEEGKNNE